MKFELLNPTEYPGWDELVANHSQSTIFHSTHWLRVLIDTYRFKPGYLCSINDNRLQCLIPLMEIKSILTGIRGVSLPFSDYCEPIWPDRASLDMMMERLIDEGRQAGWKYFELRCLDGMPEEWRNHQRYYSHHLNLGEDTEKIFLGFHSNVRRNIRKALKEGVTVTRHNSVASMSRYYRLHCLTRKRHGLPPQPYRFFRKLYEHIISKGLGFVMLAEYQQKTIAGGVYFCYQDKAMYKYGASDFAFQGLRANDLVMWKAIEWLCQNRYRWFCFGKTQMDNEGLRRFKSGWGGEEGMIKYYKYCLARNEFMENLRPEKTEYLIFRKMPILLLRWLGSILYRHVG